MKFGEVELNKSIPQATWKYILIGLLLFIIILLYISTKDLLKVYLFNTNEKTTATVTESHYNKRKGKKRESIITYTYTVNGQNYTDTNKVWWKLATKYAVGDKITITYNTKNPANSELWHISIILIILSLIFCLFIKPIIKQMKNKELKA